MSPESTFTTDRAGLDALLAALRAQRRRVIGPTLADGAIIYDEITTTADLPVGWTDEHTPGQYRLKQRTDLALFGYVVGPQSWKKYLFPAETLLWSATRTAEGIRFQPTQPAAEHYAFLGVRPCELAAIGIQDRVFTAGEHVDDRYASRRAGVFIIAVNCGEAGSTCFCTSMGTGPRSEAGYDLALTEIMHDEAHFFVVEAGSHAGMALALAMGFPPADHDARSAAGRATERAARQIVRTLDNAAARQALARNPDHPLWDDIAERCLSCANCTLACPTCFCHTIDDSSDLSGEHAERWQRWDSCFTGEFSYVHGGAIRPSTRARYRQWMTHKLATWWEQFGSSGCVGCGRCITWCPVGIDITEETARLVAADTHGGQR